MFDYLSAIYYDEPLGLRGEDPLKTPGSPAAGRVAARLRDLPPDDAQAFQKDFSALLSRERLSAFQTGVRFGARLTVQLLEEDASP